VTPGDHDHDRPAGGEGHEPPVVRDRRRIDPDTGEVRAPAEAAGGRPPGEGSVHEEVAADVAAADRAGADTDAVAEQDAQDDGLGGAAAQLAAERLADLQRLQAEYVNYRKRVERDRSVARDTAVAGVLEALLPVLDDVELARQHGDLEGGPFASIAEKLEGVLGRFGLVRYGAAGEPFDPAVHEALMHGHSADVEVTTVTQVLQPGYTVNDKVLRAARVAVTDPE
jgi:molecular chaperone GrpE